jgi:mono/diheme cytochrome c family protein
MLKTALTHSPFSTPRARRTTWIGSGALLVMTTGALALWLGGSATGSGVRTSSSSPSNFTGHGPAMMAAGRETPAYTDSSAGDADHGRQLFMTTCASCHGAAAQGLPHQGASLRTSRFIATKNDDALVDFIRHGRKPGDANSVEGLVMPPRGGNPLLDDDALRDIVAYLRVVQGGNARTAAAPAGPALAP